MESLSLLILEPRKALVGVKYGIQFENNQNRIYVSPAIFSLYKTDPDELLKTLRIKTVKATNRKYSQLKQIRKGVRVNGLLSDVFNNVNQRRDL